MTIDEAIKHCLEVAEQNETQADKWQEEGGEQWGKTIACRECAADHRQLAEWLTELKQLKAIIAGYDDVNMQKLEMVLAMIRIGSEDAWTKIEREKELKEAKRLLKAAVEDLGFECQCSNCKHQETGLGNICRGCRGGNWEWRCIDEVHKIISD